MPQIGYEVLFLPIEEANGTQTPPDQVPAQEIFRSKAITRDPLDWYQYPVQKYSVAVDNGGLGPAVRVSIPYVLTVWDVDPARTRRKDERASHEGVFVVLHVSPGTQKRTPHVLETRWFPAFKLELGKPTIVGLDNSEASEYWTDPGNTFRGVDVDNDQMWTSFRNAVWIPGRPQSVDLFEVMWMDPSGMPA